MNNRRIDPGINWIFYKTDSKKDAIAWFIELKHATPYESTIYQDRDNNWCFRIHR